MLDKGLIEKYKFAPEFSSPNTPIVGGFHVVREQTLGVVLHSTRSGQSRHANTGLPWTLEDEFVSSVNWHNDPESHVSSHAIVWGRFVYRPVGDNIVAWHARSWNSTHLGIELVQPRPDDVVDNITLDTAAQVVAEWHVKYGFKLQLDPYDGLAQHKDILQGREDGKTDIGGPGVFDQLAFLSLVKYKAMKIKSGNVEVSTVTNLTDKEKQAVLQHFDFMWGASLDVAHVGLVAQSAVLSTAAATLQERIAAVKKELGL